MRTAISAVLFASLASVASPALADRGFYVGFDIGQANLDDDKRGLDNSLIAIADLYGYSVVNATSDVSDTSLTYGLILGYQFLPYLAVEASYMDAGEFEYRARGTLTDGFSSVNGQLGIDASAKGPTLSVLGILPFAGAWNVYGRLGVFFADVDYEISVAAGGLSASDSLSRSSENFLYGVGLGYTAAQWTTRLEYQVATDLGDDDVAGKADGSRFTIGAIYQF